MSVNKQIGLLWIDGWIAKIKTRNRNFRTIGNSYEVPCSQQSPLKWTGKSFLTNRLKYGIIIRPPPHVYLIKEGRELNF